MSALPDAPLITVEQYLESSFPDGDREFVDGVVVERNVGTPWHSLLQKIVIAHLVAFEDKLKMTVLPECRTKVSETRFRVPDVLVMRRPFRQNGRVLLDPPLLVVEILSPDDIFKAVVVRFGDYRELGVPYLVLMDPEDRKTFSFVDGNLIQRELSGFEVPGRGTLPFDSRELLSRLDEKWDQA